MEKSVWFLKNVVYFGGGGWVGVCDKLTFFANK